MRTKCIDSLYSSSIATLLEFVVVVGNTNDGSSRTIIGGVRSDESAPPREELRSNPTPDKEEPKTEESSRLPRDKGPFLSPPEARIVSVEAEVTSSFPPSTRRCIGRLL